ncbi:MAG: (deoxy)nucleoside triphosphate pyrophosphohydrolase [Coriobacteriales bacterium]
MTLKTVRVVAAIIEHEGRILATQRGYGDYAGGWEFPGGKIEAGETPEQAIVREIHEEMDTAITVERLVTTVEHDYETFHLSMDCFLAHLKDGHYQLLEHSAAKWVDSASVDTVDWLPADIKVVNVIKQQGIL